MGKGRKRSKQKAKVHYREPKALRMMEEEEDEEGEEDLDPVPTGPRAPAQPPAKRNPAPAPAPPPPQPVPDIPYDTKVRATEIREALIGRRKRWEDWLERNQDALDVGVGFKYRLGHHQFIIVRRLEVPVLAYQRMKSPDHNDRTTASDPEMIYYWDLELFELLELHFEKIFHHMERLIRGRWERRHGTLEDIPNITVIRR